MYVHGSELRALLDVEGQVVRMVQGHGAGVPPELAPALEERGGVFLRTCKFAIRKRTLYAELEILFPFFLLEILYFKKYPTIG